MKYKYNPKAYEAKNEIIEKVKELIMKELDENEKFIELTFKKSLSTRYPAFFFKLAIN